MNLREVICELRTLGVHVTRPRRTGEFLAHDPVTGMRARHNARRKDASRAFLVMLKRAKEARS